MPHLLDTGLLPVLDTAPRPDGRLRVVHVGSLYAGRRAPTALFDALRFLRDSGTGPDEIEIRFVGEVPPAIARHIVERGLSEYASWTTPLYYVPSLREMATADVLLVIDADFETSPFMPSKVVDYLMFDRPIAGITTGCSATRVLLDELGYFAAEPADADGIARLFRRLLAARRSGTLSVSAAHHRLREAHDLPAAGHRYASLFRQVLDDRCPS